MKRIICHPDNLPLLKQCANHFDMGASPSVSIPVTTSRYMEKDKPTGRIIAPDGTASDREGWEFQRDDFTTWEETDLPWLLALGIVTEERELLFYMMEDPLVIARADRFPLIPGRRHHQVSTVF